MVLLDAASGDKQEKWLRKSKDLVGDAKIVRSDQYWSKAVAYVTVKTATKGPLVSQEDPLELVPVDHPNEIFVGTEFRARLLVSGTPLPNHSIKVFAEGTRGHDTTLTKKTNQDGILKVKLDKVGRYLLVAQREKETPGNPLADIQSLNFYLMVLS